MVETGRSAITPGKRLQEGGTVGKHRLTLPLQPKRSREQLLVYAGSASSSPQLIGYSLKLQKNGQEIKKLQL